MSKQFTILSKTFITANALFPSTSVTLIIRRSFQQVIQFAKPVSLCTKTANSLIMAELVRNTAVRSDDLKHPSVLAITSVGTMERKIVAVPNMLLFLMITDFPLTVAASVSRGHTPCVQSASVTIPASNPQVRNGCGCAMEPARQTSIRWLISLP